MFKVVNQLKLGQNGRSNSLFKSSVQIQEKKIQKDANFADFFLPDPGS